MKCKITETRELPEAFAVTLISTPPWPTTEPSKDDVRSLAVVAANNDKGAWGFVTLSQDEKDMIGEAMLEFEAPVAQWFWCELYR